MTVFDIKRYLSALKNIDINHDQLFLHDYTADELRERILDAKIPYPKALIHSLAGLGTARKDKKLAHITDVTYLNPQETHEIQGLNVGEYGDLLVSHLILHRANDPLRYLKFYYDSLENNGVFLGAMIGGESLYDMKRQIFMAEVESLDGATPRFIPLASAEQMTGLMQEVGFTQVIVDKEMLDITYRDVESMQRDKKNMGEGLYLNHQNVPPLPRYLPKLLKSWEFPKKITMELIYIHGIKST